MTDTARVRYWVKTQNLWHEQCSTDVSTLPLYEVVYREADVQDLQQRLAAVERAYKFLGMTYDALDERHDTLQRENQVQDEQIERLERELAAVRELEAELEAFPHGELEYLRKDHKRLQDEAISLKQRLAEVERAEHKWKVALHSLTPGGSEYADDPDRCVQYVRDARSSQFDVIRSFKEQRDTIKREVKAAREFAAFYKSAYETECSMRDGAEAEVTRLRAENDELKEKLSEWEMGSRGFP